MQVLPGGAISLDFTFDHPSPRDALLEGSNEKLRQW